jgi:hypothetical protein
MPMTCIVNPQIVRIDLDRKWVSRKNREGFYGSQEISGEKEFLSE